MSYLIVVAHPDDEVLGAGGTIHKLVQKGEEVNVCILSDQAEARVLRPTEKELKMDMKNCLDELGITNIYLGQFPNIKLNTIAHLELVQFIEKAIVDACATVIITHHPADLNNDHLQTSLACQAAARIFQRRKDIVPLKELWFMEVLSATDWGLNNSMLAFRPNVFVEIGLDGVEKKITALTKYRDVMRNYPHSRSEETIKSLAALRGSQSGNYYAEAFECAFRKIND